jgi:RNA polymerase sigma-70 factor (ECF subfamily)
MRGDFDQVVADLWWPDAQLAAGGAVRGGRDYALRAMDSDLDAGVRQTLRNVVAGSDVLIWETDLINPPDNPAHCPPSVVWLHRLDRGRVRRLTLFHPVPAAA